MFYNSSSPCLLANNGPADTPRRAFEAAKMAATRWKRIVYEERTASGRVRVPIDASETVEEAQRGSD
jgi:hypothetical protein